jgi:hypothetical protein
MMDSDLGQRLERMFAGYPEPSVDADVAWRRLLRLRRQAAIRRRAVAAGLAVAAVAAAVVGVAIGNSRGDAGPNSGHHVSHRAPGGRIAITARIPQPGVGSAPGDLAIAGTITGQRREVWGISYDDYLFKIDRRTNRVRFREHIAGLSDIAAGGGSIWVVTTRGKAHGRLLKIDPVSGSVVRMFPLPHACGQVLYAGAQLWVACGHLAVSFFRLDPETGRTLAATGTVYGVSDAVASPDGVWYVGNSGVAGFVGSGKRLRWVRVSDSAYPVSLVYTNSLVYGQGALWALTNDESVAKIDVTTGRIVRIYGYQSYDPGESMGLDFLTVGSNSLWFLADYGHEATSVLRVSIATGLPQGRVSGVGSCGEPCWQIYVAGGSVWVPTQDHITRIDPVKRDPRG